MKNAAIAVAGLLLLAVLAMWWRDGSLEAPHADGGSTPTPPGLLQANGSSTLGSDARDNDKGRTPIEGESTNGANGTRVRITVRTSTGQPAAGAEVRFMPPRSETARTADWRLYEECGDWEAVLAKRGQTAIADTDGRVEVEADLDATACARHGDGFAEFTIDERAATLAQGLLVTLRREVELRIEVVDSASRPVAGARCEAIVTGVSRFWGDTHSVMKLPVTDASGVTVTRHVLHELEVDEHLLGGSLTIVVHVHNSNPHRTGVARWSTEIAALRGEVTIRLVVPAGGTLIVNATNADGAPEEAVLLDENGHLFDRQPGRLEKRLAFRSLPLGRTWIVYASGVRVPVVGPRNVEDVVHVDVKVPIRRWWLRGTLRRSDGERVESAMVALSSPALPSPHTRDRGGPEFDFAVSAEPSVANLAPLTLRVDGPLLQPRTVVIERPVPAGEIDLGEIVVDPPTDEVLLARVELRAAGRTVPPNGSIELSCRVDGSNLPIVSQRREAAGVIHLLGRPPKGPLTLRCYFTEHVSPPARTITVGEHVILDLEPIATLQVAVRANGLPRQDAWGVLTRIGDERSHEEQLDAEQQVIDWDHITPGRYRLQIRIADHVLHDEPSIDVQPGRNHWPAAGALLDLDARITCRFVAARSRNGDSWLSAELVAVVPTAQVLPTKPIRGEGWCAVPHGPHDVLVRAHGHVPLRLVDPRADQVVHLQRCTELAFADDDTVAWDKVRVRIVEDAVTDPLLRAFDFHVHRPEFDVTDLNELQFAPGTVLELTPLRDGQPGSTVRVVVGSESPQRIDLR